MTPPGRQPPPVVPTLTDVVAGMSVTAASAPSAPSFVPPVPSAPVPRSVPEAAATAGMATLDAAPALPTEALVDTITDRVMARFLPELEWRIADALQAWLLAQSGAGAAVIAATLRDEIADHVREALGDALGSTRN